MGASHQISGITSTELIATIERSNIITILVEGRDDMSIYDILFEDTNEDLISIVQTQGRNTLLKTYTEAKKKGLLGKCIFIADSDLYVFEGIPQQYEDIIFTTGYSIENDIVADCVMIKNLLHDIGCRIFESGKHLLSKWFAFYVEQHTKGKDVKADIKPLALLEITDCGKIVERVGALEKVGFEQPSDDMIANVEKNFSLKFRGKNLIDYIRAIFFYSHKIDRRVGQYDYNQIIDIATHAETLSPHFTELKAKLKNKMLSIKKAVESN